MTLAFKKLVAQAANINSDNDHQPTVAIQLGTGLSDALDGQLNDVRSWDFNDIFATKSPSAITHRGRLSLGTIGSTNVAVFEGRLHLYEGHAPSTICQNIILAKLLGCHTAIITNAAGALTKKFCPGDVVMITDHLNLTGANPLTHLPEGLSDHFAVQHPFVDMLNAYCPDLRAHLAQCAAQQGITLKQAVYAGVSGPSLETSAERRMLANMGAQTVGMSTVNEVIMSRYLDMKVLGLSIITNMATGDSSQEPDTIEQILQHAHEGGNIARGLLIEFLTLTRGPR